MNTNALARTVVILLAPAALACAACTPAAARGSNQSAAISPMMATSPTNTIPTPTAADTTGYPPPMQTAKAVESATTTAYESAQATADAVGRDKPISATDMVHYANPVLGLSFDYPRELGEVEFAVLPGETGQAWNLRFSRFDALHLAGVSSDFSEAREGVNEDTYGYLRRTDGSTRWLTIPWRPDGTEIDVEELVPSKSGAEVVVFLLPPGMGAEADATPGPPAALVNLAGDHFPGLIVLSRSQVRLPAETLRAILQTIEVTAPTQSDAAASPTPGR